MNKDTPTSEPETAEQPSAGEGFGASDCSKVFYFGCIRVSGHYLHDPVSGQVGPANYGLQPWGNNIDSGVFGDSKRSNQSGVVHTEKRGGWTAVAWADYSVDHRQGSHSTFLTQADVSPERLIQMAREQWPQVFSRSGFPDLSNDKATNHPPRKTKL